MANSQCDVDLELSARELTALEEFRAAVSNIPNKPDNSDRYYLRWLRARNYDVERALTMFKNVSGLGLYTHTGFRSNNAIIHHTGP